MEGNIRDRPKFFRDYCAIHSLYLKKRSMSSLDHSFSTIHSQDYKSEGLCVHKLLITKNHCKRNINVYIIYVYHSCLCSLIIIRIHRCTHIYTYIYGVKNTIRDVPCVNGVFSRLLTHISLLNFAQNEFAIFSTGYN